MTWGEERRRLGKGRWEKEDDEDYFLFLNLPFLFSVLLFSNEKETMSHAN